MSIDLASLVDRARGLVSRRIFVEPAIYEQELEQIFARCWLYLGHESQLPHAGAYLLCAEYLLHKSRAKNDRNGVVQQTNCGGRL